MYMHTLHGVIYQSDIFESHYEEGPSIIESIPLLSYYKQHETTRWFTPEFLKVHPKHNLFDVLMESGKYFDPCIWIVEYIILIPIIFTVNYY